MIDIDQGLRPVACPAVCDARCNRHYAAGYPLRRRGGHDCAGDNGARGDGVGRSGDLGSGDSVGKRGASAELAARRFDDTGSDQPCGDAKDHRGDDLWWTRMVPPPLGYTEELKRRQIAAFGYHERRLSRYEEDHVIPAGAGRRPVGYAEPVARTEDSARRLGSGPEG